MTSFAEKTLTEISRLIAADSGLFAGRLSPSASQARPGVCDLFAEACAGAPVSDDYRFGLEYIFEGYLLHYRQRSRLLAPDTPQFNLLAGDYMYARGLTHIAALRDTACVRLLADLISLCAHLDAQGGAPGGGPGRLDGEVIRAWLLTALCLAGRAARGDEDFGEYLAQMDRYRDSMFTGCREGRLSSAAERERDSVSAWLGGRFPEVDMRGWLDTLNAAGGGAPRQIPETLK